LQSNSANFQKGNGVYKNEMKFNLNDLRESNEFLNSVLENINSAIFIVDKEVKIYSMNDSCSIIFNKPAEMMIGELCGNAIGCVFTSDYKKSCGETPVCAQCSLRNSILKSFTEKIPTYKQILERKFEVGSNVIEKVFQFTTKYINYNGQEMVLIIIDDITETENQKKHLREINEEKNKLLAMASHDLRNPISIIQMYSSFIMDDLLKEKDYDKIMNYLKIIKDKSNYMLYLLQDTLNISKIEAGIIKLNVSEFNYVQFVKDNIELNRYLAVKKNIDIRLEAYPDDIRVNWDRDKIEEVINNLITNAIKYSYPETVIEIKISMKDGAVLTEVVDQGQGIPENEMNHLFKPFQKTSVKATAGEMSTGLGLAIVKKIVEVHNGRVGVESKVGKGSNFYFVIPPVVTES
jgi:signal transduction histidine kinase